MYYRGFAIEIQGSKFATSQFTMCVCPELNRAADNLIDVRRMIDREWDND